MGTVEVSRMLANVSFIKSIELTTLSSLLFRLFVGRVSTRLVIGRGHVLLWNGVRVGGGHWQVTLWAALRHIFFRDRVVDLSCWLRLRVLCCEILRAGLGHVFFWD